MTGVVFLVMASTEKLAHPPVEDPRGLHIVRGKYGDLQDLIASLSEKLGEVSSHQERDFLSAYRIHQISIHEELKDLKDKVAKAEESLIEDGAVARMEEECSWFRGESARLQNHVSAMTKDLILLKTRLRELQDQRSYLSDQLKAIMKRSRVFGAEIDYMRNMTVTARKKEIADLKGISNPSIAKSRSVPAIASPKKKKKKPVVVETHNDQLHRMEAHMRSIQSQKVAYHDKVQNMIDSNTEGDYTLEGALKRQFDKIIKRKTDAVVRQLKSRRDIEEWKVHMAHNEGTSVPERFANEIPKPNGITGLGLDHFTENDKFSAVVLFLADPTIFRYVVTELIKDGGMDR